MHLNFPQWLEKILTFTYISNGQNAFKLSTIVGEIFEIYLCQMARNAFKLFTMVRENFEIHLCQIKWLKMQLNGPSWLEKI